MASTWSLLAPGDSYSALSSTSTVVDLTSTRSTSSVGSESPIRDLNGDYDEGDDDNDFVGDFEIVGKPSRKRRRKRGFQANNVLFTVADDGKVTPRLIIPHVIKSDARLTYANMVAAVYNSCDFDFMVRFMKTYFRSDFTVMQELSGNFPDGIKGKYEIYGLEVNCQYWYERMLDYPDVVFTLKDVKVQINADEDGQILADFTLAGSVYANAQEPEVQARVVIEDDPAKPVYVLGDYEDVLHSNLPPVAGSKLEKSEDFDHIFDDPGSDSEVGVEGRPTVVIDLGITATPDAASLLANEELLGDDNIAVLDSLPNKHPRVFSANTEADAIRQKSTRGTVQLPSGSSDPATIDQQINSNRLVKMNRPPADAAPVVHRYCYRGQMRMHFDADSRVFLNEFFLFAD